MRATLSLLALLALACTRPDRRSVAWREHRIDDEALSGTALRGADGVALYDLDADGHLDVVSVHEDSSHLRLGFGSPDPDSWRCITLGEGESVLGCEDVAVADLDEDGCPEIVVACEGGRLVLFEAGDAPRDPASWTECVLPGTAARGSWIRVEARDLDGDGRPELIATNKGSEEVGGGFSVFSLEGEAGDPDAWAERRLGDSDFPAINARAADIDGDGDLDVVTAGWGELRLDWYENRGPGSWPRHPIHAGSEPVALGFMMEFADFDEDGRLDLLTSTGPRHEGNDEIHWLENPGRPGEPWTPHFVGSLQSDHATGLELVDLIGDERPELFVGGYSWEPWEIEPPEPSPTDSCGRLCWFESSDDPRTAWRRHDVSRRRRGMYDLFEVTDLNGDGLLDLVTTRGNSGHLDGVLWLEQLRVADGEPAFFPARTEDSPEISLPEAGGRTSR